MTVSVLAIHAIFAVAAAAEFILGRFDAGAKDGLVNEAKFGVGYDLVHAIDYGDWVNRVGLEAADLAPVTIALLGFPALLHWLVAELCSAFRRISDVCSLTGLPWLKK